MIINLRELALNGSVVQIHEQLDMSNVLLNYDEISAAKPLHVDLQAQCEQGVVHVVGKLSIDIGLSCSRCLTNFTEQLNLDIHEKFIKKESSKEVEELLASDDEEEIHLVTDNSLELTPYVEENLIVGLPFIPLCDSNCKGLCPQCGINLNEQSCGCELENIDPRLAGLQDFFKK